MEALPTPALCPYAYPHTRGFRLIECGSRNNKLERHPAATARWKLAAHARHSTHATHHFHHLALAAPLLHHFLHLFKFALELNGEMQA